MTMSGLTSGTQVQQDCKTEHQDKREIANAAWTAAGLFNDDGSFKKPEDAAFRLIRPIVNERTFKSTTGLNPEEREAAKKLHEVLQQYIVNDSIRKAASAIDDNGNVTKTEELMIASRRLQEKNPDLSIMLDDARKSGTVSPENLATLKGLAANTVAPQDYRLPKEDLKMLKDFAKNRHEDFGRAVDSCYLDHGLKEPALRDEKGRVVW